MSEPAAKRQPIDLDEFERRLRAPATPRQGGLEDPLAELARLVSGGPDPFAPIFAAKRSDARPAAGSPAQGQRPDWERLGSSASPPAYDPRTQLRGTQSGRGFDQNFDHSANDGAVQDPVEAERARYARRESEGGAAGAPAGLTWNEPGRTRSRRAILAMSGALGLVLAGVVATLALRGHIMNSGPPPLILAKAGPVKVKPENRPHSDPVARSSSFLNQPDSPVVPPAHIVNHEEEPIDLSQAIKGPGDQRQAAPQSRNPASADSFLPKPRLVKTVSVRPDGSIISDDSPAASAHAPPAPGRPGAPTINAPVGAFLVPGNLPPAPVSRPHAAPASSQAPSATPPKVERAAAANPAPVRPSPFKSVERMAAARKMQAASLDATDSLRARRPAPARQASPVARSASAAPALVGAPAWAVQLAAPGSAPAARTEIGRLEKKFASELGGRSLVYHSAVLAGGRTVWRVRVAGLTEPDAIALCDKIKTGGGACFVARN